MSNIINIAIAGIGNCASNLIQGLEYYRINREEDIGLMHRVAGGYDITDIKVVAAFDIAEEKVGKDLSEAIFAYPNCTQNIQSVDYMGVKVQKGPVLDGWAKHFQKFYNVSDKEEIDVGKVLKETETDILIIMIPTGSHNACYKYVTEAIKAGVSVVNGIPVLITHDEDVISMARENHIAIIGDDFKSQIGGTILHNSLMNLLQDRGIKITKSYQLNYAGNMDFLNLMSDRGRDKHKSKKRGITAGIDEPGDLAINVSYLENQKDQKTCRIEIEGYNFGGCRVNIETKLTVIDSANASGVIIDAIRCLMAAKKKNIFGRLDAPSAYFMKSPYRQMCNEEALRNINELLNK